MNLGIIADDFTGANDVALQLTKYGIKIESLIELKNLPEYFVYSTETRNSSEEQARKKLDNTYKSLEEKKIDKLYKKIDSTLRGNVKAEVEELLKYLKEEEKIAVVLPFPKLGRTVKNGKLWVNEIELKETEYAKDPIWKLNSSELQDYFSGELISIDKLKRKDAEKYLRKIKSRILIFEAESDNDLNEISKLLIKSNMDKYIVASAGIMEFMLCNWGFQKEKILIVSGSCNKININQTQDFIDEFQPSIYEYRADTGKIDYIKGGEAYLLRSIRGGEEHVLKNSEFIKKSIALKAKDICKKEGIRKIIICGGDISIAFMQEFEIKKLEIVSEVETGIAYGTNGSWQLIMKPGGYGSEKIYKKMYSFLKKCR